MYSKNGGILGGYSCHNDVLNSPSFPTSTVYAQGFLDSMGIVKDFWQEPTFVELMLTYARSNS